ncbi:hypothetical protein SAMN04488546_1153 [Geodermatophilus poikilotrophus]|uniref:Cell division protein FtsL n=1 Tax=Geodermatophilus poikilotrophus TaxID=1333667 RepID=A0A1I0B859_9ACTN|nr:hypothetical protein SAMN04488546_1153 [Geodermatophilus poikilotrophus]
MSATARAAGSPAEGPPGRRTAPPLEEGAPLLPGARRSPRSGRPRPEPHREPASGERDAVLLRRVERTASSPEPPARATGSTARAAGPAPARSGRAHTAPVRVGAPRSRPAARPAASTGPVSRTAAGSPVSRLRTTVGDHRAPVVLLVVTLLVATALGLLFLNTAIAVNSLKATQLAAANEDRAQQLQRLEQQVVSGGTPAELAREARAAGMVPAGAAAYLVVGEDGTVTLRGEAVPAEEPEPAEVPAIPPPPVAGGGD